MPESNVLRNARLAGRPVCLRTARAVGADGAGSAADVRGQQAADIAAAGAAAFAEGKAAGRQAERERLTQTLARLEQIAASLTAARAGLLHQARQDLVRLALAMAERLARRALALDPAAASEAVRVALAHVGEAARVVVRVHPDDLAQVRGRTPEFGEQLLAGTAFEIHADPEITAGGCLVETPAIRLDATLEGLLGRFAAALEDWRDQEEAAETTVEMDADERDAA